MAELNIFKIEYDWCEGEHDETLIGKKVNTKEFEKDLVEAKKLAQALIGKEIKSGEYLGKGYRVECLPEFYEQVLWYLTEKKGYFYCYYDKDVSYGVDDNADKKINITRFRKNIEINEIRDETDSKS